MVSFTNNCRLSYAIVGLVFVAAGFFAAVAVSTGSLRFLDYLSPLFLAVFTILLCRFIKFFRFAAEKRGRGKELLKNIRRFESIFLILSFIGMVLSFGYIPRIINMVGGMIPAYQVASVLALSFMYISFIVLTVLTIQTKFGENKIREIEKAGKITIILTLVVFSIEMFLTSRFSTKIIFFIALLPATMGVLYAILWYIGGTRTVKDVMINRKLNEVKNDALRWVGQKEFKIDEERENFVKASTRSFGSPLYFELTFKEENEACLLHGEFYTKSWGYPEFDFREKVFWGRWPRREGLELMNAFLDFLKRESVPSQNT